MKLKSILLTGLSFVLVAALAIGGTLAYLTNQDSDVNVMTLGNVEIKQHEYQRADGVAHNAGEPGKGNGVKEGALVPYEQNQPIYPAVPKNNAPTDYTAEANDLFFWGDYVYSGTAGNGLWNDDKLANVMDKMVFVENTGKSDAYFRTIIAFECPEGMEYSEGSDKEFMMNVNGSTVYNWEDGGYITLNGVRYFVMVATYQNTLKPGAQSHPSLLQVVMTHNATNEDMELLGDTYEILVFSQAVQEAGFADAETALNTAFGPITTSNLKGWFSENAVSTVDELQEALDDAVNGDTIVLADDIEGNVTVTQKPGVKITIDGNDHNFAGVITVDGKSATYITAGLTIKDLTFKANNIDADACIRLGDGTNATRYTCNVTVDGCTFDVPGAVGVKSYTGGDKNFVITGSTATANCHSLVQLKGVDGVLVEKCIVNSKNGLNFNNSDNVTVDGCTVDVKGYAVRFGESSGGTGAAETYLIKDCTLKSVNDDGDAVIILRGTADYATLTIENTAIVGDPDITNIATNATVVK